MQTEKTYKILADYIKDNIKFFISFIIIYVVMFLMFLLYRLPVTAIMYSAFISMVPLLIIFTIDFFRYKRRYLEILKYLSMPDKMAETLEPGYLTTDKQLVQIIRHMGRRITKEVQKSNKKDRALTDYYTMWVHQIKTPISAARLICQQNSFEEKNDLKQELFKIEKYTDMALGFIRIESMNSDLSLSRHSAHDIVKQAVKNYSTVFIYKKLSLDLEDFDNIIVTDKKWLLFVLEQLLSNALKYTSPVGNPVGNPAGNPVGTPDGSPAENPNGIPDRNSNDINEKDIRIYMDSEDVLYIKDRGIGINKEDLPRIFEKGFTGFNGRVNHSSTGLGLYLCRNILDRLGNKIEIESTPDCGTTIKLYLHRADLKGFD